MNTLNGYSKSTLTDNNVLTASGGHIPLELLKANSAKILANYFSTRPTTCDHLFDDGSLRHFKATSSMTTSKPPLDAHVLHFSWDNPSKYESQLAISASQYTPLVFVRSLNGTDWGNWVTLLGTNNYTEYTYSKNNVYTKTESDTKYLPKLRMTNPDPGHANIGTIPFILALKSAGTPLYNDPEFALVNSSGNYTNNGVYVYNNSGGNSVTITNIEDNQHSANSSGRILQISTTTDAASPGRGGFYQQIQSRAGAVFVQIFRAKIPEGYYVHNAENSMGKNFKTYWMTECGGTGKWEWYCRVTICGVEKATNSLGNLVEFSSGGHVYLNRNDDSSTSTIPLDVTWYLSYCNTFDLTKGDYDGLRTKFAVNSDTVDGLHFNWINDKNDHTYFWAASTQGNAFLVKRENVTVGNSDTVDNYHANSFIFHQKYETLSELPTATEGWYKVTSITDIKGSACMFIVRAYAHTSSIFTISNGGNGVGNITVLLSCTKANSNYACVKGVRLLKDGTVELLITKPSKPQYIDISVSIFNPDNKKLDAQLILDNSSPEIIQTVLFLLETMQANKLVTLTSLTTPLLTSDSGLVLNATNTGLDLKFNNSNTSTIRLNNDNFSPLSNGVLSLGSNSNKWNNLYVKHGYFSDTLTLTSWSPRLIFLRGNTTDTSYDWDLSINSGKFLIRYNPGDVTDPDNPKSKWTDIISLHPSNITTPWTITASGFKGNADSATKLANNIKINMSGGINSIEQTFNGSSDLTIPVIGIKESYLKWGGINFSGDYGPLDAAIVNAFSANRLDLLSSENITIEYSRDGGNSWLDYEASDALKIALVSLTSTLGVFYLGKSSSTDRPTKDCRLRIIINTANKIYTRLVKFYILISTSYANDCKCTISGRLLSHVENNSEIWTTFVEDNPISGWTGWNVLNVDFVTFGNTKNSLYGQIKFEFSCGSIADNIASTSNGLSVSRILGIGGFGWQTPSTMANTNHLYSYDYLGNASFPNKVKASGFMILGLTDNDVITANGNYKSITTQVANNQSLITSGGVYTYINNLPGINKTGTVTSITISGSEGISGSSTITTSGTVNLVNSGVRSATIYDKYLQINTNGSIDNLTIPYATLSDLIICTEGSDDLDRNVVVTNKSNKIHYSNKVTINYHTGNLITTGNILASAFYELSDRNLKTNIKNLSKNLLDKVYNINEVVFNWIDSGKKSIGYIAQDYEKISELFINKLKNGILTLNYDKALVALVAALKYKISELEKRIKILEN